MRTLERMVRGSQIHRVFFCSRVGRIPKRYVPTALVLAWNIYSGEIENLPEGFKIYVA
jgi:hypothetical protein